MADGWELLGTTVVGVAVAATSTPQKPLAPLPGPADPMTRRANQVAALFQKDPAGYVMIFAPSLLEAVQPAQLTFLFTDMYGKLGKVIATRVVSLDGPGNATVLYTFEKGFNVTATLVIELGQPYGITGLRFGNPVPVTASLEQVVTELRALPGKVTFSFIKLTPRPQVLAALNPDEPLALGSAFKLFILGALVEDLTSGKVRWADVVSLEERLKSLPSGILQDWPGGSPLTMHTLATLMISQSDNTATDHLLAALGRERVEAMMAEMGVAQPTRSLPMLSTREMFLLKWGPDAQAAANYLAKDVAARRTWLETTIARQRADQVKINTTRPVHINDLEWFASSADLTRAMDWLRTHTEAGEAARARRVLAVNRGLALDAAAWPFVGFKGGSEPGVLAGSLLLRSGKVDWYAMACAWNNPAAAVQEDKLFGLMQRAAELVQGR